MKRKVINRNNEVATIGALNEFVKNLLPFDLERRIEENNNRNNEVAWNEFRVALTVWGSANMKKKESFIIQILEP